MTRADTNLRHRASWTLRIGAPLVIALLQIGCAPSQAPKAEQPTPRRIGKVLSHPALDPQKELIRLLHTVDDQGSPLLALDAETKAALDRTLAHLSSTEREQVATNLDFARARPLLHLAASGVAPVAYEALAANGIAAEEIVRGRLEGELSSFDKLSPVVLGVISRAARRVLRDCSATLEAGSELDRSLLVRIVSSAERLERNDLAEQALTLLMRDHPDPSYGYDLVRLYSKEGKVDAAHATLSKLKADGGKARALAERSQILIEAAEAIRSAPARSEPDLDAALKLARAQLMLGRFDEALQTLAPFETKAEGQLGFTAAWVEASLRGTVCPGLPPGAGVAELCKANWQSDPLVERAQARLTQAWTTGEGRDESSIEAYLALHFVVPLLYGIAPAEDPQAKASAPIGLAALEQELSTVSKLSPRLAALQLFTQVLSGAGQGSAKAKRQGPKDPDAWIARAVSLLQTAKDDRVTQTTALGVATALLQERDVTSILAQIDPDTLADGSLLSLWTKLAAWSAVASQDLNLFEKAKGALAGWLGQSVSMDLEHSQLILLLSECDAALHATDDRKWKTLEQLGSQLAKLAASELGPEARIVQAIGLARTNQHDGAIAALSEQLDTDAKGAPTPNALKSVAAGFRLGLKARSASGSDRSGLEAELDRLLTEAKAEKPPSANTELWLELWRRALRLPRTQCELGACSAKVLASSPDLQRKIGARATRLLKQGILPLGGAGLSLDYSFSEGLRPLVQLEPQLFAVGP